MLRVLASRSWSARLAIAARPFDRTGLRLRRRVAHGHRKARVAGVSGSNSGGDVGALAGEHPGARADVCSR